MDSNSLRSPGNDSYQCMGSEKLSHPFSLIASTCCCSSEAGTCAWVSNREMVDCEGVGNESVQNLLCVRRQVRDARQGMVRI